MTARYAIYLPPPANSELARFAACWLGRDVDGTPVESNFVLDGISASKLRELTQSPRHYAFHGTLKAPFALRVGCELAALRTEINRFAAKQQRFSMPLKAGSLSGFLALMPAGPAPAMNALAGSIVREFDHFRAELSNADLAQRRQAGLTERQDRQLCAYGYPYIFEDFRFHMTLTERLSPPAHDQILAFLQDRIAGDWLNQFMVSEIALYGQPGRDTPFVLIERFPFGA